MNPPPAPAGIHGPVQRILVLRALMLGDMVCASPALRALRRAWPRAQISLLGLRSQRDYLSRLPQVDELLFLPGWPGLPEQDVELDKLPGFLAAMQARRWDLALQLQGSGLISNSLLALLGARHNAGFFVDGAHVPAADTARFLRWPQQGREVERLLALCRHLQLPVDGGELEFPMRDDDAQVLQTLWPTWGRAPYACLHPGARLPSRRWPLAGFAALAQALHQAGLVVVLTGGPDERRLGTELGGLLDARGVPHVQLIGRTPLGALGALLGRAQLLVCNDTGVSHLAAALRRPSLVLSCGGDAQRWAPADERLHRVLAAPADCRPCAHAVCPSGHACAQALTVDTALRALHGLLNDHPIHKEEPPCRVACAS